MKAPKQTQKQQIARLENVYFQTWTMLKMVEKELAIIQEHLGLTKEDGADESE